MRRRVLVCAPLMPEFDREGGSRRVFHFLEFFQQAGWSVSFAADNALDGERYAKMLQQMGIPIYVFHKPPPSSTDMLADPGELFKHGRFDLILIAFWDCAEQYVSLIRALSPLTKIVVDSIDIHFLRESRRVFCGVQDNAHSHALDSEYAQEMRREIGRASCRERV